MSNRRAVSPMLSVIILIGIATVGGVVLYSVQNHVFIVSLSQVELRVSDINLEKDQKGNCYFYTQIYNSGTDAIQNVTFSTTLDNGNKFTQQIAIERPGLLAGDKRDFFLFPSDFDSEVCKDFILTKSYPVFFNYTSVSSESGTLTNLKISYMSKT